MAAVVVVVVMVFLTLLVSFIPGDPVTAILGPRASPDMVGAVRREMGLDQSMPRQVWIFMTNVLQGDLGTDFASNTPVSTLIGSVLPHTLLLAVGGLLVIVVVGMPLGIFAAVHHGGRTDKLLAAVSISFVTMPPYVAGLLLLLLFAIVIHAFPAVGTGELTAPADYLWHLVLPAVALGLAWVGYIARILRSSMLEVLNQNYVRAAESFGVSRRLIHYKYALRNAVIPTVAVLGVGLGSLIGNAIFIEIIFARPGLGSLIYDAVQTRNYTVLRGGVLVVVLLFIAANLIADFVNMLLDPRTRVSERS